MVHGRSSSPKYVRKPDPRSTPHSRLKRNKLVTTSDISVVKLPWYSATHRRAKHAHIVCSSCGENRASSIHQLSAAITRPWDKNDSTGGRRWENALQMLEIYVPLAR